MQLSHRDPFVKEALKDTGGNLKTLFGFSDAYDIVFFGAGGRGAVEAALSALIASNKSLLIAVNGRWSQYMADIAKKYDPSVRVVAFEDGKPLPIEALGKEIESHKPDVVCFVGHETERGLLNPIGEVVALCKRHGCMVLLDAMSSIVVHDIDYEAEDVDIVIFSATKALRSIGGLSMVAIKQDLIAELEPSPNHYLDLKAEHDAQSKNILARMVLPSNAIFALQEATAELLEEGLEKRRKDIAAKLDFVKTWVDERGFKHCTDPQYVGNFSTSFYLPDSWDYQRFSTALHEKGYFLLYGYEGKEGRTVEVCTVGYMSMDDVKGFTSAADSLL